MININAANGVTEFDLSVTDTATNPELWYLFRIVEKTSNNIVSPDAANSEVLKLKFTDAGLNITLTDKNTAVGSTVVVPGITKNNTYTLRLVNIENKIELQMKSNGVWESVYSGELTSAPYSSYMSFNWRGTAFKAAIDNLKFYDIADTYDYMSKEYWFEEDFSDGVEKWSMVNAAVTGEQAVTLTDTTAGKITIISDIMEFCNGNISFDFSCEKTMGFIAVQLRTTSDNFFKVIVRSNAITYIKSKDDSVEYTIGKCNIQPSVTYTISIDMEDTNIDVSLKSENDGEFTKIGSGEGVFCDKGKFSLSSWQTIMNFDNVKIINRDKKDLKFRKQYVMLETGVETELDIINKTGQSLVYAASDEGIVATDEDGTIKGISAGTTVVMAQAADGSISAQCNVVVYNKLESLKLNKNILTLRKGEQEDLKLTLTPENALKAGIVWESSDNNIVQLFGSDSLTKSICAKNVGEAEITVKSKSDESIYKKCLVKVVENNITTSKYNMFHNGFKRKIPPYFFGVGESRGFQNAGRNSLTEELLNTTIPNSFKYIGEMGYNSIRGGFDKYDYRTGKSLTETDTTGLQYLLSDHYAKAEKLGVPIIYTLSLRNTAEELLDEVEYIRTLTAQNIYVELGNEMYNAGSSEYIPNVETYVARLREFYPMLKQRFPDIKLAVSLLPHKYDRSFKMGDQNWENSTNDPGYTVASKGKLWNTILSENADCYDAVVVHPYLGLNSSTDVHANEILKLHDNELSGEVYGLNLQSEQFAGKEIWVTEYGLLPYIAILDSNLYERTRHQYMKDVGSSFTCMSMLLNMLDNESITMTNFQSVIDDQGFGAVAVDGTKLPNYYMFSKLGELFKNNSYYYGFDLRYQENIRTGRTQTSLTTNDISAWGFGSEGAVEYVVFENLTENIAEVCVDGFDLTEVWCYKGKNGNPFPSYLNGWSKDNITVPDDVSEESGKSIKLAPLSVVIAEVNSDMSLKLTEETKNKISCSALFKKDSNLSFFDGVLENIGDAPVLKRDNTFAVPLDFISSKYFLYIKCSGNDVNITDERDMYRPVAAEFTLGSVDAATDDGNITLAFAPFYENGEIYIPADFAAIIVGEEYNIVSDDIFVIGSNPNLTSEELNEIISVAEPYLYIPYPVDRFGSSGSFELDFNYDITEVNQGDVCVTRDGESIAYDAYAWEGKLIVNIPEFENVFGDYIITVKKSLASANGICPDDDVTIKLESDYDRKVYCEFNSSDETYTGLELGGTLTKQNDTLVLKESGELIINVNSESKDYILEFDAEFETDEKDFIIQTDFINSSNSSGILIKNNEIIQKIKYIDFPDIIETEKTINNNSNLNKGCKYNFRICISNDRVEVYAKHNDNMYVRYAVAEGMLENSGHMRIANLSGNGVVIDNLSLKSKSEQSLQTKNIRFYYKTSDDYRLTDNLISGVDMKIEADIERITEKSVEGIVLVGIYDENGSLVKTSYNNLEWDENGLCTVPVYCSIPENADAGNWKCRFFVWNDIMKMMPLSKCN